MKPEVAKLLANTLSQPHVYKALTEYTKERIESLHFDLERVKDYNRISEIQGAIDELRRIEKLRESAMDVVKVNSNG